MTTGSDTVRSDVSMPSPAATVVATECEVRLLASSSSASADLPGVTSTTVAVVKTLVFPLTEKLAPRDVERRFTMTPPSRDALADGVIVIVNRTQWPLDSLRLDAVAMAAPQSGSPPHTATRACSM